MSATFHLLSPVLLGFSIVLFVPLQRGQAAIPIFCLVLGIEWVEVDGILHSVSHRTQLSSLGPPSTSFLQCCSGSPSSFLCRCNGGRRPGSGQPRRGAQGTGWGRAPRMGVVSEWRRTRDCPEMETNAHSTGFTRFLRFGRIYRTRIYSKYTLVGSTQI
jgi:hypothetical protein